jgi:hypothetical protein
MLRATSGWSVAYSCALRTPDAVRRRRSSYIATRDGCSFIVLPDPDPRSPIPDPRSPTTRAASILPWPPSGRRAILASTPLGAPRPPRGLPILRRACAAEARVRRRAQRCHPVAALQHLLQRFDRVGAAEGPEGVDRAEVDAVEAPCDPGAGRDSRRAAPPARRASSSSSVMSVSCDGPGSGE